MPPCRRPGAWDRRARTSLRASTRDGGFLEVRAPLPGELAASADPRAPGVSAAVATSATFPCRIDANRAATTSPSTPARIASCGKEPPSACGGPPSGASRGRSRTARGPRRSRNPPSCGTPTRNNCMLLFAGTGLPSCTMGSNFQPCTRVPDDRSDRIGHLPRSARRRRPHRSRRCDNSPATSTSTFGAGCALARQCRRARRTSMPPASRRRSLERAIPDFPWARRPARAPMLGSRNSRCNRRAAATLHNRAHGGGACTAADSNWPWCSCWPR